MLHPPVDQPQFVVEAVDGASVDAVICWRSEAEFTEDDYRVVAAGLPLYIKTATDNPKDSRTVVLERTTVGHRVRLVSGPSLGNSERERLKALIGEFNRRWQEPAAQQSNEADRPPLTGSR